MDDTRREERADPSPPRPSHDTGLSSWVMVVFTGELDIGARSALNVLDEAVRAHPGAHVLVDLSDVTFMDSTALVAFAEARSRTAAGGGVLSLHGASAFAQRMLDIWHLEPVCSRTRQAGDVHAITTLRGHSVVPFPRPRASQTQHSDDRPSCVGDSRRS